MKRTASTTKNMRGSDSFIHMRFSNDILPTVHSACVVSGAENDNITINHHNLQVGFHFGSKKLGKISIVFEDLSRNSVFFEPKRSPIYKRSKYDMLRMASCMNRP